jgi:cell division septation protein DedD
MLYFKFGATSIRPGCFQISRTHIYIQWRLGVGFIGSLIKKRLVPAGPFFIIFMLGVLAAILPSCGRKDSGQEVISKRVKLDLPNTPGEQQPKTDVKPAVGNMPDVKADLPMKEVVKPDTAKPAIKVEIPEKKEPEVVKDKKAAPDLKIQEKGQEKDAKPALASSGEPDKKPVAETTEKTTEKTHVDKVKKKVYTKAALKKAKLKPWAVNVASFPNAAEAKKLISRLKASGYNGYTTEFTKSSMKWHRVRVGFYRTRDDALKAGKRIETKFHFHAGSAWPVQPGKEETLEHIK